MELEYFQKWDGRGLFLLRLDYGHNPSDFDRSWSRRAVADLNYLGLSMALERLSGAAGQPGILAGADRLADLSRRRGGASCWDELARVGQRGGLLLWTRFPKASAAVSSSLANRGLLAGSVALEPSGETPPLYQAVDEQVYRLHLTHEWETGLAQARATTVLIEAGGLMASAGALTARDLAVVLGTTAGASRSYLRWMVDAGLARRTSQGYTLRHPALADLFRGGTSLEPPVPPALPRRAAAPPPPGPARASTSLWHPEEMD